MEEAPGRTQNCTELSIMAPLVKTQIHTACEYPGDGLGKKVHVYTATERKKVKGQQKGSLDKKHMPPTPQPEFDSWDSTWWEERTESCRLPSDIYTSTHTYTQINK